MFVKGGKLVFVYNFFGIPPEQRVSCPEPELGKHVVAVEFVKEKIGAEPTRVRAGSSPPGRGPLIVAAQRG
jgi:hypothetical protein